MTNEQTTESYVPLAREWLAEETDDHSVFVTQLVSGLCKEVDGLREKVTGLQNALLESLTDE